MSLATVLEPAAALAIDPLRKAGGKVIVVWGAAGSGKSSLALNLAFEFASLDQRTLLIDADSYRPSLAAMLGVTSNAPGITAVLRLARAERLNLEELHRLSEEITFQNRSLRLLTGINAPTRWRELDVVALESLLEFARGEFDYVVLDIASELEEGLFSESSDVSRNHASLELTKLADCVLGSFSADPVGISRFISNLRDASFDFLPIANRVRSSILGKSAERQIRDTLFRLARLKVFALIPEDGVALDVSQQRAQPLLLAAKSSKVREVIRLLALEIMDQPAN